MIVGGGKKFDPVRALFWACVIGFLLVGIIGLFFGNPVAGVDY